ncbi:hypothetical protein AVEN_5233-1 [Araneus ventricosus]|uniref:Uncharacterized protein n=1 Tax=Araneus ventricosus TaxID=182803 RepID=A0A4Y2T578_ARAVE|nr:hypothetical protein AVEN_5233-1 [Araneus ventricosus]
MEAADNLRRTLTERIESSSIRSYDPHSEGIDDSSNPCPVESNVRRDHRVHQKNPPLCVLPPPQGTGQRRFVPRDEFVKGISISTS